jgi:hypothetical protein
MGRTFFFGFDPTPPAAVADRDKPGLINRCIHLSSAWKKDELVKSQLSDGFVKRSRSRLANLEE